MGSSQVEWNERIPQQSRNSQLRCSHFDDKYSRVSQNKTFFSYLTSLNLPLDFDPIFAEIPLISKKLNSLSLNFQSRIDDDKSEFRSLLVSIRQLTHLKSFKFNWPGEGKDFWSHFKPQPSLEHLMLTFNAGLFEQDKLKDVVAYWADLEKLKTLEFSFSCLYFKEFSMGKMFMTKVLKKAQNLKTLKFWIGASLAESGSQQTYEPFFVEDVPIFMKRLGGLSISSLVGLRIDQQNST